MSAKPRQNSQLLLAVWFLQTVVFLICLPKSPLANELWHASNGNILILHDAPIGTSVADVCCGDIGNGFVPLQSRTITTEWGGDTPLWFKIVPKGKTGVLQLTPGANEVILYRRDPATGEVTISRSGNMYPADEREIIAPSLAFRITQQDLGKQLFLKLDQNFRLSTTISFIGETEFHGKLARQNLIRIGLYGAILIMIVYNMFLSIVVQDVKYFLNSIIITQYLWYDAILTGFGSAYIWGHIFSSTSGFGIYAILNLLIFGCLFIFMFLRTPDNPVGPERFLLPIIAIACATYVIHLFVPAGINQIIVIALAWFTIPLTGILTIYLALQGNTNAKILLAPLFAGLVPGLFLVLLEVMFGLRIGEIDSHILEITLVLEAILFSLALATRIRITERAAREANGRLIAVREESLARSVAAQDSERERLSKELHDGVGQEFLVVLGGLKQLTRKGRSKDWKQAVPKLINSAKYALEELRRISKDMYPYTIVHLGLIKSVESLLEVMETAHQIETSASVEIDEDLLSQQVELHIYRIIQECLSNIARHSSASCCRVQLRRVDDQIELKIEDDGIGIQPMNGENSLSTGLGLTSISERALALQGNCITSNSQLGGLCVFVQFPIPSLQ